MRFKAFIGGLGLDAMSFAWHTVVQLVVVFDSGLQWGISQEYSFFFSSQWSIWDALIELESHYANRTFYVFLTHLSL